MNSSDPLAAAMPDFAPADAEPADPASGGIESRALSSAEYHASAGVSQSMLKVFVEDPELFRDRYVAKVIGDDREPTESMRFGLALEKMVFYGTTGKHLIPPDVLNDQGHRMGGRWIEYQDRMRTQHGADVELLTMAEWDAKVVPVLTAHDRLRQHDRASKLLWGQGTPHVAYFWTDEQTGLQCKCQLDVLSSRGIIVDLKAMADVRSEGFAWAVNDFRYHWQAWWYREAVRKATGETMPFIFVCAKNKPSHHVECYELGPEWYTLAEFQIRTALTELAHAHQTDDWHSATHGQVTVLHPPKAVLSKMGV